MDTAAIVKPGDKAIIYLNTYHLNFSREREWDSSEGDFLWLPENSEYRYGDGVAPEGLRIRTNDEMVNIGSRAILEVQKGGYELLNAVPAPLYDPKFEEILNKLDSGEAQMFVTYASMLPEGFVANGLPTEEFLGRARKGHWRICLISLFANPHGSGLYWKSSYFHFGKEDDFEAVSVIVTDPAVEAAVNAVNAPAKKRHWFSK